MEFITDKRLLDDDTLEQLEAKQISLEGDLSFSKKRSIEMLTDVMGLPDLVVEKIFIKILESYNWHFDKFGPEEEYWKYEEIGEEDSEDYNPEFQYNTTSALYDQ